MDLVCSSRGPPPLPSVVDVSALRHRTRDELERALKGWDARAPYDMALYRDTRVRANLGTRYDARENLSDWDYQAIVRPAAGVVHGKLYRGWRAAVGIAFAENWIHRRAENFRVARAGIFFNICDRCLREVRKRITFGLKLGDSSLELGDRSADVWQLNDICLWEECQCTKFGQVIIHAL